MKTLFEVRIFHLLVLDVLVCRVLLSHDSFEKKKAPTPNYLTAPVCTRAGYMILKIFQASDELRARYPHKGGSFSLHDKEGQVVRYKQS
jgi:hypothetical protein